MVKTISKFEVICPICNSKIIGENYHGDYYGVVEEYTNCPTCGYSCEFLYGNIVEVIGNKEFVYQYDDDWNKTCLTHKRRNKVYFTARRRWKKYKKGVTYKNNRWDYYEI